MAPPSKRIAVGLMAGIWVLGMGCAAVLAYTLNRPLEPGPRTSVAAVPPPLDERVVEISPTFERVLSIAPVTITAKVSHPRPVAVAARRELPAMTCTEWRQLDIGSGRVQICQ